MTSFAHILRENCKDDFPYLIETTTHSYLSPLQDMA